MPNVRHAGRVWYCDESRPSGRLLGRSLIARGYAGRHVNWGVAAPSELLDAGMPALPYLNQGTAVLQASNKRLALAAMGAAGVPTPAQYRFEVAMELVRGGNQPIVARTERHRGGSGFWLCNRRRELREAREQGATHFMEYVAPSREFRVHVAFDSSIKLTEKMFELSTGIRGYEYPQFLHGDDPRAPGGTRNFANGWRFRYPQEFGYRPSLREVAKGAVRALGLDFGAVDVLWRSDGGRTGFFVTEVNTAPDLRSNSDILERYTEAFYSHWRGE